MSPWGREGPSLAPFLAAPDLGAELRRVDAEAAALGLARTEEITADLPPKGSGHTAVIRGYEGHDVAGRTVHAVRVATPFGVVLAVGPLDAGEIDRTKATELVPSLPVVGESLAYRSGTDLNGDGAVDVVLKNDAGAIEIWHISERGSGPYGVSMIVPPTRASGADGRVALWGELPAASDDPLAPKLSDVATFDGRAYSDGTPAARAWHAREALSPLPTNVSDAIRLRAAVEHAWHAILSGEPKDSVIHALGRERAPASLKPWVEVHQRTLASIRVPGAP